MTNSKMRDALERMGHLGRCCEGLECRRTSEDRDDSCVLHDIRAALSSTSPTVGVSDTSDLVKRLRDRAENEWGISRTAELLLREAADRIESLESSHPIAVVSEEMVELAWAVINSPTTSGDFKGIVRAALEAAFNGETP